MPQLFPSQPKPIRVLIVDDDDGYAGGLSAILSGNPRLAVVGRANDGVHGIELARRLRPDVVVMDVNMPRLDGFAATQEIVAERPATRVVIVSAAPEADHRLRARDAGADAYLPKDCDLRDLDETVTGERTPAGAPFLLAVAV
jgi:two-component system, NarL family, response regulator LiaR